MNQYVIMAAITLIALVIVTAGVAIATDKTIATDIATCTSCGKGCTKDSNCGLSTCGAVNGGTCGCGK
jgi:hypothetical protein